MHDLPPVSMGGRNGATMAADYDILKAASNDLFKKDKVKNTYDPYADDANFDPWNKPKEGEGKSMKELMKEKMEKMEKEKVEPVDDRKARLKAQRDLLVQKKKQEMHNELKDAREGKTDNKYSNNLFKEFLSLDKKVSQQEEKKKRSQVKKDDSPEIKPQEDNESQPIPSKNSKKDMKSLFDDSDDEDAAKSKEAEIKARQERQRQIMKQIAKEGNTD